MNWLHRLIWEYGMLETGVRARRNRWNGVVQFVLWKRGDKQGNFTYQTDFWHVVGYGHQFIPDLPAK